MLRVFSIILFVALGMLLLTSAWPVPPAQRGVHPVIDAANGWLFGGSIDGKYRDPLPMAKRLKGGEAYRLYTFDKCIGTATGAKPQTDNLDPGEEARVAVTLPPAYEKNPTVIGICGGWNALPRVPREESVKQPVYLQAVRDVLKQHGLPNAPINITRIVRVDLDGDGKDEVLLSATTPRQGFPDPAPRKNDYSFVVLRKIINGKVVTIPLDGTYITKDEDFSAPNAYTLDAVLDVNGDGVMEPILGWAYYEGNGRSIYGITGKNAKQVLCAGWGA